MIENLEDLEQALLALKKGNDNIRNNVLEDKDLILTSTAPSVINDSLVPIDGSSDELQIVQFKDASESLQDPQDKFLVRSFVKHFDYIEQCRNKSVVGNSRSGIEAITKEISSRNEYLAKPVDTSAIDEKISKQNIEYKKHVEEKFSVFSLYKNLLGKLSYGYQISIVGLGAIVGASTIYTVSPIFITPVFTMLTWSFRKVIKAGTVQAQETEPDGIITAFSISSKIFKAGLSKTINRILNE